MEVSDFFCLNKMCVVIGDATSRFKYRGALQ